MKITVQPQQPSNSMYIQLQQPIKSIIAYSPSSPATKWTYSCNSHWPSKSAACFKLPPNELHQCLQCRDLGGLTIQCDKCNASKFKKETKAFSCGNGKYKLDILPPLPQEFNALYSGNSLHSEHFLSNLRKYNCTFQITFFLAVKKLTCLDGTQIFEFKVKTATALVL